VYCIIHFFILINFVKNKKTLGVCVCGVMNCRHIQIPHSQSGTVDTNLVNGMDYNIVHLEVMHPNTRLSRLQAGLSQVLDINNSR
jgi:hypothetical protein